MAEQRLNLTQTQTLVMTPQLQQAIKLLQLSNLELAEYLDQEIEKNPLLEKDDKSSGGDETALHEEPAAAEQSTEKTEDYDSFEHLESDSSQLNGESPLDVSESDYYSGEDFSGLDAQTDWSNAGSGGRTDFMPDDRAFDENLSREKTLFEHLHEQVRLELDDQTDKIIATHLIDYLDEAGYLTEEYTKIKDELGCGADQLEQTLSKVQQFDPPGCFARNLAECLALQLKEQNRYDPAMEILLANLDMLAQGKIDQLVKLCHVDMQDLADMIAEIKQLNPKPAEEFSSERPETLVPDVIMKTKPDGTWHIELNSQTLPKVLVNNRYYTQISRQKMSKNEQQYIGECYQSANWLVKALHQRAQTILKVATAIVELQDGFFRKGIEHLKPLTLKDIALRIDMHESTVSRVTTNKYMTTPRGVFELKYFFTSSVGGSDDSDAHSAEFVRHKIKVLVEKEPPKKPLSDEKLVKLLKDDGVDVARRTVAKYRELLGIPSSSVRRRQKSSKILMNE